MFKLATTHRRFMWPWDRKHYDSGWRHWTFDYFTACDFAPGIIFNLISASWARKNGFRITIDVNKEYPGSGKVSVIHKVSRQVVVIGPETIGRLFELAIRQYENSLKTVPSINSLWHQRLKHCIKKQHKNLTLSKTIHEHKPDLTHIRSFGIKAYVRSWTNASSIRWSWNESG